jgi:hypothetical protein
MNTENKNTELNDTDKKLHISDVIPRYKLEFEFATDYHHVSNGDWKIKDLDGNIIETYSPFEREKAIKRRDELNGV